MGQEQWQGAAATLQRSNVAGFRPYIIALSPQPQRVKVLQSLVLLLPLQLLRATAAAAKTEQLPSGKHEVAKRDAVDPDKRKRN